MKLQKIRVTLVDMFVRDTGVHQFTAEQLAKHFDIATGAASRAIQAHLAVQRGKVVCPYNGLVREGNGRAAVWYVGNHSKVADVAADQFKRDVACKARRNPKAVLHTVAANNPKARWNVNEALLAIDAVLASL